MNQQKKLLQSKTLQQQYQYNFYLQASRKFLLLFTQVRFEQFAP